MSQRTTLAYKRTLLKECVHLCSPRGNVRRNVRISANKTQTYALSQFQKVRLCSRTNEQVFAVRLRNPSFVEHFAEVGRTRAQANFKQRDLGAAIRAVVAARAKAS